MIGFIETKAVTQVELYTFALFQFNSYLWGNLSDWVSLSFCCQYNYAD